MKQSAVIVAGGMGKRLGKPIPKAFVEIANKEMFRYSLELFDSMGCFESIVLVVPAEAVEETKEKVIHGSYTTNVIVVEGGEERWNSVENGVIASGNVDLVAIHDAARPFVTEAVVNGLLEEAATYAGIITANPVVDTVREFHGHICGKTIDRSKLIAVGTPQVFNRATLLECFDTARHSGIIPTDEAMLLESCGKKVHFIYGDPLNFKVTAPSDMILAEAIVKLRERQS